METSILSRLNTNTEKYAEKVMFKDEHSQITFGEFNALTKSIGTALAEKVPCGSPVAVMSGRHVLTPSCFLGAVRAGCFYAPMDGDMPKARLNQMLSEATGQPLEIIEKDTDRDNFLSAQEALEYGLIDHIMESR